MYPGLTPRLRTVAELVPAGSVLADVGTDHGYLPVSLVAGGRIPSAIATDLRAGPLERARRAVERYGLEDLIQLRLCDGLAGVRADEVDAVTIAGMGGETILGILEAAPWSLGKTCILQPMSAVETLRAGLDRLGADIAKEVLVQEGDAIYVVLALTQKQDQSGARPLTAAESFVGRREAHAGDPLWPLYLARAKRRAERALDGLERSARASDQPRKEYFQQVLAGLNEMTKEGENP